MGGRIVELGHEKRYREGIEKGKAEGRAEARAEYEIKFKNLQAKYEAELKKYKTMQR